MNIKHLFSKTAISIGLISGLVGPGLSYAVDSDNDGISDSFEIIHGFDENDPNDVPLITLLRKYHLTGNNGADFFGSSVSKAGDVNNDGVDDLIVGAHSTDFNGDASGSAYIYSGSTGQELFRIDGAAGDGFGARVSAAGDVNKDGHDDLIIGAPNYNNATGYARVVSGINGSTLYTFTGPAPGTRFGQSVSVAGDVNNDTYPDVVVGSTGNIAKIYSGLNGAVLYSLQGEESTDHFGYSVAGIGDINNDNHDDVIVGAYRHKRMWAGELVESGVNYFISGIDGSMSLVGAGTGGDRYAWDVSSAGDVNNDNVPDYVIGAPYDDSYVTNSNRGAAFVISGADHSKLYSFYGNINQENFASSTGGSGDVNGDGYADVIIGSANENFFQVFSGKDGSLFFKSLSSPDTINLGADVAFAGDINNDGYSDIIVGDNRANTYTGAAHVYLASVDTDLDGISDDVDIDDDGDGLSDEQETLHSTNDKLADTDGDGINDGDEVNTYQTNPLNNDTDNDGLTDGTEVNTYQTDPLNNDTDNDGLTDGAEVNTHFTSVNNPDSDNDGLTDGAEVNTHLTDPKRFDSDSDGVADGLEVNTYLSNPLQTDSDSDGLTDGQEVNSYGSSPTSSDTDSDTLSDYDEVNTHNTNPALADSDNDGLADNLEINNHNTNPVVADTDSDGLEDGAELNTHSTNPLLADSDNDGVIDGQEIDLGANPNNTDSDNDGLTDGEEVNTYGTNPVLVDTDSDSLSDILEINTHGTNPLLADSDGDGLADNDEMNTHTTNPLKMDSDGNGINDSIEINGQANIAPNWLVSNSEVTFQTQANIARPANIKKVLTADFNLDGLLDLVYAATNSISLSYQNADHTFAEPIVLGTGNVDKWVAADIDGDSDLDIYYAESYNLRAIINNGLHGFSVQESSQHMGYTPNQLIVSDFDEARDGEELIWVQKNTSYKVSYDLSDNSVVRTSLTMARTNTTNASFVDLTNDGLLDQLMEYSGYTYWAENLGNDSFTPANLVADNLRFNAYNSASSHFTAKLTGNEFNDVVFGNQYKVYLMKNNGHGQFADKEIIAEVPTTGTIAQVQPADIDLDGDVDILVGATDAIYLVKNNGDGTFTLSEVTPLVSGLNDLQVGDINRDGSLDLISTSATDQKLSWYENSTNLVSAVVTINHIELLTQTSLSAFANDANNDALQFSLSGDDSALFEYSAVNGLTFKSAPTTASPADVGGNNIYDLIISANDGTVSTDLTVQITVLADTLDTDNDGLTDSQENTLGTNPNNADTDNDGLTDGQEVNTYGTNPNLADTDSDGLSDGQEVNTHGTNPNLADSDSDGLSDGLEVNTHSTNPLLADSDNDGTNDGDEITAGTNPNINDSTPDLDTDGDTLSDNAEINTHGTNINLIDTDSDGVNDGDEVAVGTNPTVANTDYIISFEDGLLPVGLPVIEGSSAWVADDSGATHGRYSLKAMSPENNQASSIRLEKNFAATQLVFQAKISSEIDADYLIITLDESQELLRLSGELDWQEYRLDIPAGAHTIDFSYTKDINLSSGSDTAWIDHIRFTTDPTVVINDSDNDGLSDLQENTLYLTNPNLIDSDWDGVNDGDEIALGSNPNAIENIRWYGFEDGLPPSGMATDETVSHTGWAVDNSQASQSTYSLKANTVSQGQIAHIGLWANFEEGSNLSFDVKISSTLGQDGMAVYVDDQEYWINGGELAWSTITLNVPAGLHSVSFIYGQNGSSPSGQNTAWIDNIRITQAEYGENADMDEDGLSDQQENQYKTLIWVADTDGDGISDGDEVNQYGTNPTLKDSDNDGIDDQEEINQGSHPGNNEGEEPASKLDGSSGGGSFGLLIFLSLFLLGVVRRVTL